MIKIALSQFLKHYIARAVFIIGVLFFLGAGCEAQKPPVGIEPEPPPPSEQTIAQTLIKELRAQSSIKKFVSMDEVRNFVEEHAGPAFLGVQGGGVGMMTERSMTGVPVTQTTDTIGGSPDYSRTNIQVEGVDEGDIAKTDGEYIYTISGNDVVIVKAFPADKADVAARITLGDSPQGLYIHENHLIVYGYENRVYAMEKNVRAGSPVSETIMPSPIIRPGSSFTFASVFDISDEANPKEMRRLSFEGDYVNSRMIGEYLYFVTNSYTYGILDDDEPPLPLILENGNPIGASEQMPPVYYFDFPYQSPQFTSVAAVNIADNAAVQSREVYLLDSTQTMYVSPENLYLTYTKYLNEYEVRMKIARELIVPSLNDRDKERIQKISAADSAVLSKEEKLQKINAIIERHIARLSEAEQRQLNNEITRVVKETYKNIARELEKTVIHKISLNRDELKYQGSGEVTGAVLNQFSMDESGGYFRIATTKNRQWSFFLDGNESERDSYSNLYVLDSGLKVVGSLERLAPGERIYSARFMQGRAYLVTFKQTDPLFVIDVGEPTAPRVLGELKIPGFSQYLHPYDDTTLIGFGRDTEERPQGGVVQKGLKLSLFDVANVTAPKEIDAYIWGNRSTYSLALNDHRAFLFSRGKNLLVIPFEDYETIAEQELSRAIGEPVISSPARGAAVFSVTREGFSLKGNITHGSEYDAAITRTIYISENLYAVSARYVTIQQIADIREFKRIILHESAFAKPQTYIME
ncbi:MAG: beta-propeller domain-containing protein [Candidatus Jacksonbacteria bacterium]|nr:beta-propeller domain-containing protein [Candidatus Jacksonbacteria bacterium]